MPDPRLSDAAALVDEQADGIPPISVIVASVQDTTAFKACLFSLAAQDSSDFEVVIVTADVRSDSAAIADRFCKRYKHFRAIAAGKAAHGAQFNAGMLDAQGEFVMFVNGHDCLATNAISTLHRAQINQNCDIVAGNVVRLSAEGGIIADESCDIAKHQLPARWEKAEQWLRVLGDFASSTLHGRIYRRSLLIDNGIFLPEALAHESLFFTHKALQASCSSYQIDRPVYFTKGGRQTVQAEQEMEAIFTQWADAQQYLLTISAPSSASAAAARRTIFGIGEVYFQPSSEPADIREKLDAYLADRRADLGDILRHFERSPFAGAYMDRQALNLLRNFSAQSMGTADSNGGANTGNLADIRPRAPQFPAEPVDFDSYGLIDNVGVSPDYADRIGTHYNAHKGKRCFIVGSANSLSRHDLSLLAGEYVFASGRSANALQTHGISPTFCVAEREDMANDNGQAVAPCDAGLKFLPASPERSTHDDKVISFPINTGIFNQNSPYYGVPRFSTDPSKVVYLGCPAVFNALQFAFFMGFTEVYIIGVETEPEVRHSQFNLGHAGATQDSSAACPSFSQVEMGYLQAKLAFDAVGRKLYNATIGAGSGILPRADFDALFQQQEMKRRETLDAAAGTPTTRIKSGNKAKRLRKLLRDPHKYFADSKFAPIRPLRHLFKPYDKDRVKPRSKRRAKFLRDPYLYFADSKTFILRPLKFLFYPTGWSNKDYEIVEAGRRRAGGLLSRLPVSRKRLSGEMALLSHQQLATTEQIKTQKSALSQGITRLRQEIQQQAQRIPVSTETTRQGDSAHDAAIFEQRLLSQAILHLEHEAQLHAAIDDLHLELAELKRAIRDNSK